VQCRTVRACGAGWLRDGVEVLVEERDGAGAGLQGGVAWGVAEVAGEDAVRGFGEAAVVAGSGVEFDHLERVAEVLSESGETLLGS
jgi:hypothetical protein